VFDKDRPYVSLWDRSELVCDFAHEQRTAPGCTAFLVAPNLAATAGHCLAPYGPNSCDETQLMLGYRRERDGDIRNLWAYECESVIALQQDRNGTDFALFSLAPIEGSAREGEDPFYIHHVPPLFPRAEPEDLPVGQLLSLVGHPAGMPLKIASGRVFDRVSDNEGRLVRLDRFELELHVVPRR
jgi:V8-like Glu-specific endopeptidase